MALYIFSIIRLIWEQNVLFAASFLFLSKLSWQYLLKLPWQYHYNWCVWPSWMRLQASELKSAIADNFLGTLKKWILELKFARRRFSFGWNAWGTGTDVQCLPPLPLLFIHAIMAENLKYTDTLSKHLKLYLYIGTQNRN